MAGNTTKTPRVLIVAGSDSSGGAGIQADLKTVSALGAYGMTAITALTAQNTRGVFEVVAVEARFVARQMEACFEDIGCDTVKTGMLASTEIVEAVAETLSKHLPCPLVVDPVMTATAGSPLLDAQAVEALKSRLFPLAAVVTPNLHEATALLGRDVETLGQMREAARAIHDWGPQNVVIKGGHLEESATDVLFDGQRLIEYHSDRVPGRNCHGSGCIFASAIAAGLAKGKTVSESVAAAKEFVTATIAGGLALGGGPGPANPMF